MLILLSNVLNLLQNGHFSFFSLVLVAIFVTIAMVKVELMSDFYSWIIVLINLYEAICEKLFLIFSLIGGKIAS